MRRVANSPWRSWRRRGSTRRTGPGFTKSGFPAKAEKAAEAWRFRRVRASSELSLHGSTTPATASRDSLPRNTFRSASASACLLRRRKREVRERLSHQALPADSIALERTHDDGDSSARATDVHDRDRRFLYGIRSQSPHQAIASLEYSGGGDRRPPRSHCDAARV